MPDRMHVCMEYHAPSIMQGVAGFHHDTFLFTLVTLVLFNLNVSKKFVDRPVSQTSAREHASPPGTPPPG